MLETVLDRYLVGSIATVSLLYSKLPNYDPDVLPEIDLAISLDDLKENDLVIEGHTKSVATYYDDFLHAILGDKFEDHPLLDSIVGLRFKDEALTFVTRPKICMIDGYPTLLLGADVKDEVSSYKFPLSITSDGITIEGSKIKRLAISSLEIQKADQSKIKLPIACFNHNKTLYAIHISVSPDVNYYDLQEAWEDKDPEKLGEMIAAPYGASANLNAIFYNLMESNAFPADGVVLPLTGLLKKEKVDSKTGGGSFWKASYSVDTSKLPNVYVTAYYDGESRDDVPLNLVTTLTCYQGEQPLGQMTFTDKAVANPPTVSKPWFLHVKGKDPKKKSPIHVVFQGQASPRCIKVLEKQSSLSYFPMPSKPTAIPAKATQA